MHWVAAMWLADQQFVLPSDLIGVPNKVAGECILCIVLRSTAFNVGAKYTSYIIRLLYPSTVNSIVTHNISIVKKISEFILKTLFSHFFLMLREIDFFYIKKK